MTPPADANALRALRKRVPGIYIASKTTHADRWRLLRDKVGEPIISSWIDEAGDGETANFADLWRRCLTEASSAALTIIYHERGEILKGAFIELGAALSHDRQVFVVGDPPGTWPAHPNVRRFREMKEAIAASRIYLRALEAQAGRSG